MLKIARKGNLFEISSIRAERVIVLATCIWCNHVAGRRDRFLFNFLSQFGGHPTLSLSDRLWNVLLQCSRAACFSCHLRNSLYFKVLGKILTSATELDPWWNLPLTSPGRIADTVQATGKALFLCVTVLNFYVSDQWLTNSALLFTWRSKEKFLFQLFFRPALKRRVLKSNPS